MMGLSLFRLIVKDDLLPKTAPNLSKSTTMLPNEERRAIILQIWLCKRFTVLVSERHKAETLQCVQKHLLYLTWQDLYHVINFEKQAKKFRVLQCFEKKERRKTSEGRRKASPTAFKTADGPIQFHELQRDSSN